MKVTGKIVTHLTLEVKLQIAYLLAVQKMKIISYFLSNRINFKRITNNVCLNFTLTYLLLLFTARILK